MNILKGRKIERLDKPHVLFKTLQNLKDVNFQPTKRIINKIIQLVTSNKFQLLPSYLIKRKQIIAKIRITAQQPNLTFKINNQPVHGIADSGSFFSILPFHNFKQLNLSENNVDKSQQFSIQSATEIKTNAVLGTINLSNPTTRSCQACLKEKSSIKFRPEGATLNARSEFLNREIFVFGTELLINWIC